MAAVELPGLRVRPPRTSDTVFTFGHDELMVVNSELDRVLDRACPKDIRAPPLIIGVAGGTASGKTTVCMKIQEIMADERVGIISMDNFYRPLTEAEKANVNEYNFDHPDAFDVAEVTRCLDDLRKGKDTRVPEYDFKQHARSSRFEVVKPKEVILFEGILVLHIPEILKRLNMKIYVDTDDDLRLSRRILRDIKDRGRDVKDVIQQYTRFVKVAQDKFVTPSRKMADVIIPWNEVSDRSDDAASTDAVMDRSRVNMMAVELVTEHLKVKLRQHPLVRQYPNLECMESSPIIKEMHTIIRNRETSRADFVFYADRLIRLLVEYGLGYLPFNERCVVTPEGHKYVGVDFARSLCGVSIIRSGEAMESALRDCCQGIKIGKILVHRDVPGLQGLPSGASGEFDGQMTERVLEEMPTISATRRISESTPQPVDDADANVDYTNVKQNEAPLVYCKLPDDVVKRHVLLMDPILSSGFTVVRAIEKLLEHGCDEHKLYLLCLIAAPQGIHSVCRRFPGIRVLVSEIDNGIDKGNGFVVPGIGEFGNRYFSE